MTLKREKGLVDVEPGIYLVDSDLEPVELKAVATRHNFHFFHIDGHKASSKEQFLQEAGRAMQFPDYYGMNWDAFDECVRDLSWLPAHGYIIFFDHFDHLAGRDPAAWDTARYILHLAIEEWRAESIPFYVLLRGSGSAAPGVPHLHAA